MGETITISKKQYDQLLRDSALLECLEGAGVDNWEGYGYAWEAMEENYPEYTD